MTSWRHVVVMSKLRCRYETVTEQCILIHLSVLLVACSSSGDHQSAGYQIWVSPDGNDSNSGTLSHPFKTLKKAQQKARELSANPASVTVNLKTGSIVYKRP